MTKTLLTLSLATLLAGCGQEKYADAGKFAEHFGQKLLGEQYKTGMVLMEYKGFSFENAKVGIDRNLREYVSADVSIVLPWHKKYYRHVETAPASNILDTWPAGNLADVAGNAKAQKVREAFHKARNGRLAPVIYSAEPVDLKKLASPWRTIRIIRHKDGEGRYHPAGNFKQAVQWFALGGDETMKIDHIPSEPFYAGPGGLLSEKAISLSHAVMDGTARADKARADYTTRLQAINAAIAQLNACCATQATFLATERVYGSTNTVPKWIRIRQKQTQDSVRNAVNAAKCRARDSDHAAEYEVRRAEHQLRQLNAQAARAEKDLSRAKAILANDMNALKRLAPAEPTPPQSLRREDRRVNQLRVRVTTTDVKAISDCEAKLTSLKAQVQSAETALAQAKARQDKVSEEGRAAVAKAESDGQARLEQAAKTLQAEYRALRKKSTDELMAQLAKCERLLQPKY